MLRDHASETHMSRQCPSLGDAWEGCGPGALDMYLFMLAWRTGSWAYSWPSALITAPWENDCSNSLGFYGNLGLALTTLPFTCVLSLWQH